MDLSKKWQVRCPAQTTNDCERKTPKKMLKSNKYCCAPHCFSNSKHKNKIPFYRFPLEGVANPNHHLIKQRTTPQNWECFLKSAAGKLMKHTFFLPTYNLLSQLFVCF